MLHAGLDLSRKKLDVCLLSQAGEIVEEWASPPDGDGLRGLVRRAGAHGLAVRGVIESMTGPRPTERSSFMAFPSRALNPDHVHARSRTKPAQPWPRASVFGAVG